MNEEEKVMAIRGEVMRLKKMYEDHGSPWSIAMDGLLAYIDGLRKI